MNVTEIPSKQSGERRESTVCTRAEVLERIDELEAQVAELRENLPRAIKTVYKYRCDPGREVFVYAGSRAEADNRLAERMNRDYPISDRHPHGWRLASPVVDVLTDPVEAANASPGNLLRCFSPAEAAEFAADYRADEKQELAATPKRTTDFPPSRLARDVHDYEINLRRRSRKS
ncbi:hypothetical protein [Roseimaritima ulvae]|uniref:Uncharacterized protein n=1 Tax=Roseimaritima ulvae TaxID=980254 RepID=A0A5B9R6C5_9BACT|nr:hypothetical protein [Roseimaritima ulvae]QEG42081.1 hypothetical protein UC8_41110 [Roseimaritima ulvae]